MAITVVVTQYIVFSDDQTSELIYNSGELEDSPCVQELVTLAAGDNTINLPSVDDFTVHGVAIVPPSLNAIDITLKGIGADTGIPLSENRASVFLFTNGSAAVLPVSIILAAGNEIDGVRLVWF